MRFDATVVIDAFALCEGFGTRQQRCYDIDNQELIGGVRIDEHMSLAIYFTITEASPYP